MTRVTGGREGRTARALERAHMPSDDAISLARYTRRGAPGETRIPDDFGPSQSLRGFEDDYRNIVDYIVRITHRIWEADDVEYIGDCYAPDSRVFDDYGLQIGSAKIIADTHHTTSAFSDIELVAEEVIWAGDDEIGFHTSHRVRIRGTNDGPSRYGPATGRRIEFVCMANCVARDNDIFLEHVTYNTAAMLTQLGHDPVDMARTLAAAPPPGWPRSSAVWEELRASVRPARPLSLAEPVDGFDPDAFVRTLFDLIWSGDAGAAEIGVGADRGSPDDAVAECYAADVAFEGPGGRGGTGIVEYAGFVGTLRSTFVERRLAVDEVYWMASGESGHLVAVRWSMEATHGGAGDFGEPSGAPVQIWGITQLELRDERVAREWMLFNEFDVMMQIARARHDE